MKFTTSLAFIMIFFDWQEFLSFVNNELKALGVVLGIIFYIRAYYKNGK